MLVRAIFGFSYYLKNPHELVENPGLFFLILAVPVITYLVWQWKWGQSSDYQV